ncbi:hypothetical protein MASR1M12_22340 [Erysipelotrichia bacterium]
MILGDDALEIGAGAVHLVDKTILGTRYLSAWRQTVSDCGDAGNGAEQHDTAVGERAAAFNLAVKSTWPACR